MRVRTVMSLPNRQAIVQNPSVRFPERAVTRRNENGDRLMQECPNLSLCGFFKKYNATKERVCKGFVYTYCHGEKQSDCKRKEYKKQHGKPPSDDMMPNGLTIT